jgi:hypothetical protein
MQMLGLALFHRERPDAKFMVLTAYLDESGTHGNAATAVVMAGYIGNVAQWSAFETSFAKLLEDNGARIYHAKKFRDSDGDFKGWSAIKKSYFHAEFTRLIDENLEHAFFAMLSPSQYKAIYKGHRNPKKIRDDTEYGMCFRACLSYAAHWMGNYNPDDTLNLVLECGQYPNLRRHV